MAQDTADTQKAPSTLLARFSFWIGLIAGAISILGVISYGKDFINWVKYVELKGSFANEHWKVADEKDFSWLVGKWDIPKLRGFTSEFKIENGKLYRQNIANDDLYAEQNFVGNWMPVDVHISTEGLLRFSYPGESKVPFDFIQKEDKCCCYENNRYIEDDNTLRSGERRQLFLIDETILSEDGYTYKCR